MLMLLMMERKGKCVDQWRSDAIFIVSQPDVVFYEISMSVDWIDRP